MKNLENDDISKRGHPWRNILLLWVEKRVYAIASVYAGVQERTTFIALAEMDMIRMLKIKEQRLRFLQEILEHTDDAAADACNIGNTVWASGAVARTSGANGLW